MENAATAASVSRTTAYRYFDGIHDLLVAAFPTPSVPPSSLPTPTKTPRHGCA